MTEYWVSKKQYWCKYCNIWIRDDAPSRKQHETGLKHQGSKERFIRDLYKSGNQAKRDKATEAIEIARINAAAEAAHSRDTQGGPSRPSVLASLQSAAPAARVRDSKPTDKWANYSSAKDLGFDDEETKKSAYEIEQEIKGRAAPAPGAWQEVVVPVQPVYTDTEETEGAEGVKRKLGEYADDDEGESFRFEQKRKPVRDPYDEEDWDPKKALGGLKLKSREAGQQGQNGQSSEARLVEQVKLEHGISVGVKEEEKPGGLDRGVWTGKLELQPEGLGRGADKARDGLVYVEGGGWVKAPSPVLEEDVKPPMLAVDDIHENHGELKPIVEPLKAPAEADTKPVLPVDIQPTPPSVAAAEATPPPDTASSGLFKKRRPPPGNRKK